MVPLNNQSLESLKAEFAKIDTDNNGVISMKELQKMLKNIGLTVEGDALRYMFDSIDDDGDGVIEFDEFLSMYAPPQED